MVKNPPANAGESRDASASASVLPMNIQDRLPLGWSGWISLQSKGLLSLLQHHSSKASILQCSAFFMVQLSPWPGWRRRIRHRKSLAEQVKPGVWGENAPRPRSPHPQPTSHCRCPGYGLQSSSEMSFPGEHSARRNLEWLCVPVPPVFRESECGGLRGGSRY